MLDFLAEYLASAESSPTKQLVAVQVKRSEDEHLSVTVKKKKEITSGLPPVLEGVSRALQMCGMLSSGSSQ